MQIQYDLEQIIENLDSIDMVDNSNNVLAIFLTRRWLSSWYYPQLMLPQNGYSQTE
jgi:hypothetical protein